MKTSGTLLLLICAFATVDAQNKRTRPKTAPKPAASPSPTKIDPSASTTLPRNVLEKLAPTERAYADKPFGAEMAQWSSVPQDFAGHDFKKIWTTLGVRFKAKDEFESTEAYQKRIADAAEKPIIGTISANSPLAFSYEKADASYDADRLILTVTIDLSDVMVIDDKNIKTQKGIQVAKADVKDLGTYVGSNAFGAERTIKKSQITEYMIVLNNPRDYKAYTDRAEKGTLADYLSKGDIKVELNLPPEKAREAKANLTVLFLCSLAKPYAGIDFDHIAPKIDSPIDITTIKEYLAGRIDEIWLFNRATGEIYQKIKAVPLVSGKLRVSSTIIGDNIFLLLDKSMTDILRESGAVAVDHTRNGGIYDLIQTFIKANSNSNSKKYQEFISVVMPAIQAHTIRALTAKYGDAEATDIKFGNYYVFGVNSDYFGTSVWDVPITINAEENSIYLGAANVTYK
jgi:hypothetical protein